MLQWTDRHSERHSRQTQAILKQWERNKVEDSFSLPWLTGPKNAKARCDLKGLVSGSSKDIPIRSRRCMTQFSRMRQRKKQKENPKSQCAGIQGRSDGVGTSCFRKSTCKKRDQRLSAWERQSLLLTGLQEKPEGKVRTVFKKGSLTSRGGITPLETHVLVLNGRQSYQPTRKQICCK